MKSNRPQSSHKVGGQGGTQCLFRQEDTLCLPQARRINFIRSDEVSTLSIAKPISRTGRSGGLQLLAALPIHGTGAPLSLCHRQRPL